MEPTTTTTLATATSEDDQSPSAHTTTQPDQQQQQQPTTTKRKKSWYSISRKLSFDTTFITNNKNIISPDHNNITDPNYALESPDIDFQRHPLSHQDESSNDHQTNTNNNNSHQVPFLKSVRKKVKKAFNGNKSNSGSGQGKLRKAASCSNLNQALYPYPTDTGDESLDDDSKTSSATLDSSLYRRKHSTGILIPGSDYYRNDGRNDSHLSTSLSLEKSLTKHEQLDDNNNQYSVAVTRSAKENGAIMPGGGGVRARKVSWAGVIQPSINEDAILRTGAKSSENPGVSGGKESTQKRRKASRVEHVNLFAALPISESHHSQYSPDSASSDRPAWFPSDEECAASQANSNYKSSKEQTKDPSSTHNLKECTDKKVVSMSKHNTDLKININNNTTKSTANSDEQATSWNIIQYDFIDEKDNHNHRSDRKNNKKTTTTTTVSVKETKNCKNKDSNISLSSPSSLKIKTDDNLFNTFTANTKEERNTREKGPTIIRKGDVITHNGSEEAMRTLVARLAKAADNSLHNKAAGNNKRDDANRKTELIEAGIDTRTDKNKQQNCGDDVEKITKDTKRINTTTKSSTQQREGGVTREEKAVFEIAKNEFPTVIDFSNENDVNDSSACSLIATTEQQRREEKVYQNKKFPSVIDCNENDINEHTVKTAEQGETATQDNNNHIMKSTHNDPNNHHNYNVHENDMNNGVKERMPISSTSSTTTADKAMAKPKYIYSVQSTHNSCHNYVDEDTERPLGKHLSSRKEYLEDDKTPLHFDINNNNSTAQLEAYNSEQFVDNSECNNNSDTMLGKNIVKKPYDVDDLYIASRPGKSNGIAPSNRENLFESNYLNRKNQQRDDNNNNLKTNLPKTNLPTSKISIPTTKPVKVCTQQHQKHSPETVIKPQTTTTTARKIPLHVSVEDIQCLVERILIRKLSDKTFEEARVTTWCKEIVNTVRDQIKLITEESFSSRRKVIASAYIGPKTKENSVHVAIKCQKQMNTDDFITVAYESDSLFVWVSLMMAKY